MASDRERNYRRNIRYTILPYVLIGTCVISAMFYMNSNSPNNSYQNSPISLESQILRE